MALVPLRVDKNVAVEPTRMLRAVGVKIQLLLVSAIDAPNLNVIQIKGRKDI